MKYQIGDEILVLHSNEEGKVVDFINDKMVMIEVRGVKFPAYMDQIDFPYFKIKNHNDLVNILPKVTKLKGRFICEVHLDLDQHFSPKLTSKKLEDGSMITSPLHDMWPFLSEEELNTNILT